MLQSSGRLLLVDDGFVVGLIALLLMLSCCPSSLQDVNANAAVHRVNTYQRRPSLLMAVLCYQTAPITDHHHSNAALLATVLNAVQGGSREERWSNNYFSSVSLILKGSVSFAGRTWCVHHFRFLCIVPGNQKTITHSLLLIPT